jgi:hypothetical protein
VGTISKGNDRDSMNVLLLKPSKLLGGDGIYICLARDWILHLTRVRDRAVLSKSFVG